MEILILWLILSAAAGVVAMGKGRNGLGVFALSLLLSPLIGFLVALTMERHAAPGTTKVCPYCAEAIKSEATVCRYCQREQPEPSTGD